MSGSDLSARSGESLSVPEVGEESLAPGFSLTEMGIHAGRRSHKYWSLSGIYYSLLILDSQWVLGNRWLLINSGRRKCVAS